MKSVSRGAYRNAHSRYRELKETLPDGKHYRGLGKRPIGTAVDFILIVFKYQVAAEEKPVYNKDREESIILSITAPWQLNDIRDAVPYK